MNKTDILNAIKQSTTKKYVNHIFGTSNKKLKAQNIISFDIPAITTCPFANDCKQYCYADKIQKRYPNVRKKWTNNFELTKQENFVDIANESLKALPNTKFVRVHASGDFYSREYLQKWFAIAENNPNVVFYAYTKSAIYFKHMQPPANFLVCQSLPLVKDCHYQPHLQHAQIFYSIDDYKNAINLGGYLGAKDEDLFAVKAMIQGKNIALLDHALKAKLTREEKKKQLQTI